MLLNINIYSLSMKTEQELLAKAKNSKNRAEEYLRTVKTLESQARDQVSSQLAELEHWSMDMESV